MINGALRLFVAVTLGFCLLLGAMLLIVRASPLPLDHSLLANNPCELPCLYGITAGVTTAQESYEIIQAYRDETRSSFDLNGFFVPDAEGHAAIMALQFDPQNRITETMLWALDLDANIGQLRNLLLDGWKPTHVYRSCTGMIPAYVMLLFGDNDEILVQVRLSDGLTPDSPISLVSVTAQNARSLPAMQTSFCTVETGWQGLAPAWKYDAIKP